ARVLVGAGGGGGRGGRPAPGPGGAGWCPAVAPAPLAGVLRGATGPVLVDCLGTWLTRRIDAHGAWADESGWAAVQSDIGELVAVWRAVTVPVVAVSNEVGSGVVPATASGRRFRDLLGRLNAAVAAGSESVVLVVAGRPVRLR
ncbi:bifunctional adenosylcobinamide kinase/adenosylcobinamide-phosphate guanylyltransferase, partial [Rhodococcus sp. NPDC058514]|uniref:bifunctional adenosylcobinamide kinase/adenosylcobinamide-phosphate guanylyltransferase n=1 Tax=Rhodococcus sp. NPDC058514 TaxID=3346532 RepID=UPI003665F689